MRALVLVHGGAGHVPEARRAEHVEGCVAAARAGQAALRAGESALAAAVVAVEVMENDARYNAGTGGSLTSDGTLELAAAVMEGRARRAGAVAALPPFPHPIRIALALLEAEGPVMLAGGGAARWAAAHGFVRSDSMITARARERLARWREGRVRGVWAGGTVGAVALAHGTVAAATSTGGTVGKPPGRVGDSPIVGAGTWADDASAAVSCTGVGEPILRVGLARTAADRVAELGAQGAAEAALGQLEEHGGEAGLILVAPDGTVGIARNTTTMSWALCHADGTEESGC